MNTLGEHRAYLAGVLHGDGWCTDQTIGLRVKDQDFAAAFALSLNAIFATKLQPRTDERGYWLVRTSNKTQRFSSLKSYKPRTRAERAAWLRGLFDSEGNAQCLRLSRGENSYQRRISFYSTAADTLMAAIDHLDDFGIAHKLSTIKNSSSHKGTKVVFELRLCRREAFQSFVANIGSTIKRKRIVLDRISSTFQPAGWQARNWSKAVAARWA